MRTIQDVARHVLNTTNETDPKTLAQLCLHEATTEELTNIFEYAIRAALREAADNTRTAPPPQAVINGTPVASRRVQAVNAAWTAYKRTRVSIGGQWRLLGTLNADELREVAHSRHKQAAEITAKAHEYEKLAALMEERNASTVADLADADIDTIRSEAA